MRRIFMGLKLTDTSVAGDNKEQGVLQAELPDICKGRGQSVERMLPAQ